MYRQRAGNLLPWEKESGCACATSLQMSLMLIAYSGANPLHLTPGKLLSDVHATFGILLPLQSGACRLRQKARAIYCLAVQMLLEGAQLSRDHL